MTMSGVHLAVIGGIWLSLLYSAAVMPASVWVIQLTVSRNWRTAANAAAGLSIGQFPWCLAAGLILFNFPHVWRNADLLLRFAAAAFLLWLAFRCQRAPEVETLRIDEAKGGPQLTGAAFSRSFLMPLRLPLWAAFILSVGVHLRGPGPGAALLFAFGAVLGQLMWHAHFILVAGLFGRRVPEDISLHSLNKLRLLATLVNGGLALIILAPVAFPSF